MLSFFKSPSFRDVTLGEFARSRGHWRGTVQLGDTVVPLVLAGGRSEPDPQALQLARTIAPGFPGWRPAIADALFEHYQPYAEALAAGELPPPSTSFPRIGAPGEVWPHVVLAFASVTPLDRILTIEFGLSTEWDEEHTLGARFRQGRLLELCGSILPP
jgi:hypothetical protein